MGKERDEAFMRVLVGIVSGVILWLWGYLVGVIAIFHWIYVLFTDRRNKDLAKFCNVWVTQAYRYFRYMTFASDKRVFPFAQLGRDVEWVE